MGLAMKRSRDYPNVMIKWRWQKWAECDYKGHGFRWACPMMYVVFGWDMPQQNIGQGQRGHACLTPCGSSGGSHTLHSLSTMRCEGAWAPLVMHMSCFVLWPSTAPYWRLSNMMTLQQIGPQSANIVLHFKWFERGHWRAPWVVLLTKCDSIGIVVLTSSYFPPGNHHIHGMAHDQRRV